MSDTTEPAIPVIAPVPVQAYRDLLQFAEIDLGGLSRTGVRVAVDITEDKDATVKAIVTVAHVNGGRLDIGAKAAYRGRFVSYGGFVQWSRE
jgi:hypothetical protein